MNLRKHYIAEVEIWAKIMGRVMKKSMLLLFFVLVADMSLSQTVESVNAKMDSLENLKSSLNSQLQKVEAEINELKKSSVFLKAKVTSDSIFILKVHNPFEATMKGDPKHTVTIQKGDSLELFGYSDSHFDVIYNSAVYSVLEFYINNNLLAMGYNNLDDIKRWALKQKLTRIDKEWKIKHQKEKEQKAISQKRATEERKKKIIEKYGDENGTKILKRLVWIGMTKEMAVESWGNHKI